MDDRRITRNFTKRNLSKSVLDSDARQSRQKTSGGTSSSVEESRLDEVSDWVTAPPIILDSRIVELPSQETIYLSTATGRRCRNRTNIKEEVQRETSENKLLLFETEDAEDVVEITAEQFTPSIDHLDYATDWFQPYPQGEKSSCVRPPKGREELIQGSSISWTSPLLVDDVKPGNDQVLNGIGPEVSKVREPNKHDEVEIITKQLSRERSVRMQCVHDFWEESHLDALSGCVAATVLECTTKELPRVCRTILHEMADLKTMNQDMKLKLCSKDDTLRAKEADLRHLKWCHEQEVQAREANLAARHRQELLAREADVIARYQEELQVKDMDLRNLATQREQERREWEREHNEFLILKDRVGKLCEKLRTDGTKERIGHVTMLQDIRDCIETLKLCTDERVDYVKMKASCAETTPKNGLKTVVEGFGMHISNIIGAISGSDALLKSLDANLKQLWWARLSREESMALFPQAECIPAPGRDLDPT